MKISTTGTADRPATVGRGFWPMRDIPTVAWLLAAVLAALAHRWIPAAQWLLIHLLLLGAVTHAILVWSQYFSYALLRSRAGLAERRGENIRLILANAGALGVLIGVPTGVWGLTALGAALLVAAVGWHGVTLWLRLRRNLPGKFGHIVRYYIAAAGCLVIGGVLGALIARGGMPAGLVLAHLLVNTLGWIGLTVAGTLVTFWPTVLRTRADPAADIGAARALPVLVAASLVAAAGAAIGVPVVLVVGLAGYLVGLVVIAVSGVRAARSAPPTSFAALSIAAAFAWWTGSTVFVIVRTLVGLASGRAAGVATAAVGEVVPFFAAGFAAQVLVGALSYLIPVVLGGGPAAVRAGTWAFDRAGVLRVTTANVALVACALPVSSVVRVAASVLYLVAMASFLVLLVVAMRAQRRAKREGTTPGSKVPERPPARGGAQLVAGLLAVLLVVAGGAAASPASMGWGSGPAGAADAPVTTVRVTAADMRFTPNRIEVPAGHRLVIELTNTDPTQTHDLVLANGVAGSRLAPGESERIDAGVITADVDGWCSIVGHRQLGMTLTVIASGAGATPAPTTSASPTPTAAPSGIDLTRAPGPGFTPYDATLPALPAATGPTVHRTTLSVTDTVREVAPGVTQTLWTYNGTAPGPVLHGRVGDTFEITLRNDSTMGHSIDFHAGALAPDQPMRTIPPGESLSYTFTATRAGIWMYHCSTMPMSAHIANGMYGAVVIEPDNLAPVDQSFVLIQGEYYLGDHHAGEVDTAKIAQAAPDLVTFNGYAAQYDHAPLQVVAGKRVRIWVLDAGIDRPTSFHIVGGQFDTTWAEGRYLVDHGTDTGAQALALAPAQGGFVELAFPEAGTYPFVSHYMVDAERGAHGLFRVSAG